MVPRHAPPPPQSHGNPVLYVVLGAMGVALAGAGGFIWYNQQQKVTPSSTIGQIAPSTTTPPPPPSTTLATPPPTAAPPPTFGEVVGKGASFMRAATVAFLQGDYDKAMTEAQKVLREDANNADAKRLVQNALNGQKAENHFTNAENALRQGDFDRANKEVDAGRELAAWDPRANTLTNRIQAAQREAQQHAQAQAQQQKAQQLATQINTYVGQGDSALQQKNYDGAIALYEEALKLDSSNQRALNGKSAAIQAKATAQNVGPGPVSGGKRFVNGKTTASSLETKAAGTTPEGFEDTPGVAVKKGSQAAELPGKIVFDVNPDVVKSGDRYTVKIYLLNEGNAPIGIRDVLITTKINGKGASGALPSLVRDVAPQQKALILELPNDIWKEDTATWSIEAVVRTTRGERYANTVTWK
jgi:tetratricopeptide (TPR) repeat protein